MIAFPDRFARWLALVAVLVHVLALPLGAVAGGHPLAVLCGATEAIAVDLATGAPAGEETAPQCLHCGACAPVAIPAATGSQGQRMDAARARAGPICAVRAWSRPPSQPPPARGPPSGPCLLS